MRMIFAVFAMLLVTEVVALAAAADVGTYAFVQEDGSLKIGGRTIRLHGIHIPATQRICDTTLRPPRCGTRAAVALRLKIQGFVSCDTVGKNADGTVSAVCRVRSNDPGSGTAKIWRPIS